jgi:hypothetical protein
MGALFPLKISFCPLAGLIQSHSEYLLGGDNAAKTPRPFGAVTLV